MTILEMNETASPDIQKSYDYENATGVDDTRNTTKEIESKETVLRKVNEEDDKLTSMDVNAVGREYVAIHPYVGQNHGELSIEAADVIMVTEVLDTGWWYGYHDNREGWFPGSYVENPGGLEEHYCNLDCKCDPEEYTPLCGSGDTCCLKHSYSSLHLQTRQPYQQSPMYCCVEEDEEYCDPNEATSDDLEKDRSSREKLLGENTEEITPETESLEFQMPSVVRCMDDQISSVVRCIQHRLLVKKTSRSLVDLTDAAGAQGTVELSNTKCYDPNSTRVSSPVLFSTTSSIVRRSRSSIDHVKAVANCSYLVDLQENRQMSQGRVIVNRRMNTGYEVKPAQLPKPDIPKRSIQTKRKHIKLPPCGVFNQSLAQNSRHMTDSKPETDSKTEMTALTKTLPVMKHNKGLPPPRPPPPSKEAVLNRTRSDLENTSEVATYLELLPTQSYLCPQPSHPPPRRKRGTTDLGKS